MLEIPIFLDVRASAIEAALNRIADALEKPVRIPLMIVTGGDISFSPALPQGAMNMFVLPADNPDFRFAISPVSVTDSEGNAISGISETFTSTDETVISLLLDTPGDIHAGGGHVGSPGVATLNYVVMAPGGVIVKSIAKSFTVTAGAPALTAGGDITFEGITEQPE